MSRTSATAYADCVVCGNSIYEPHNAKIAAETKPEPDDVGSVRYRHAYCDPEDA